MRKNSDQELSWFEKQFVQTDGCVVVAATVLLFQLAFVLALLGLIFCKNKAARGVALWMLIGSTILMGMATAGWLMAHR